MPFLTIFSLKKYHMNKYTILSLNRIMTPYSNAYDYVIYLNYYYEDKYLAEYQSFCAL